MMSVDRKGKRSYSLKRKLLFSAIPMLFTLLLIEGLFRVYDSMQIRPVAVDDYERLLHHPAYTSKPWFSPQFLTSSLAQLKGTYTKKGPHLWLPVDREDPFLNIRDGLRATVGFDCGRLPPGRRPRKLFVLGGSTTFCMEVPDAFTHASLLQERLAAISETRGIEVVNCGIRGAVSLQEVELLEYEVGQNNIPDFCVFFDGLNNTLQGVINGYPTLTMREAAKEYRKSGIFTILRPIARVSVAARTIFRFIVAAQRGNDPAHTRSEAKMRELAQATADSYEQTMLRAKEICDRHGIRMLVFLQPTLYTIDSRPLTSDERAMAARERKSHGEALRICYRLLREKLSRLRQQGIMAYDISDAFDGNREPIFVDQYHVESTGNRLIAEAILKNALPILRDSSLAWETAPPSELDRRAQR